jgi:hypothetical protein
MSCPQLCARLGFHDNNLLSATDYIQGCQASLRFIVTFGRETDDAAPGDYMWVPSKGGTQGNVVCAMPARRRPSRADNASRTHLARTAQLFFGHESFSYMLCVMLAIQLYVFPGPMCAWMMMC